MSVAAINWAFSLPIEPRAKLVLIALADNASDDFRAWPSLATLAAKTSQSTKTVQRRLQVLEELGVCTRMKRYRENGSRTSDLFCLLINVRAEDLGQHADEDQDIEAESENVDEIDASSISRPKTTSPGGADTPVHAAGTLESGGPGQSGPRKDPPSEPNLTPKPLSSQRPPAAEAFEAPRQAASIDPPSRNLDGLEEFKAAYDLPSNNPARVEQLWSAFNPEERKAATMAAHSLAALRRTGKVKSPPSQERFLGDPKIWREYAASGVAFAAMPGSRTIVVEGSAAFNDWLSAFRIRGMREPPPHVLVRDSASGRPALSVPSEYPPLVRGAPAFDVAKWFFIPKGDQRWKAWRARIAETFEQSARFTERSLGPPNAEGRRESIEGNWFPFEWPPSAKAERERDAGLEC